MESAFGVEHGSQDISKGARVAAFKAGVGQGLAGHPGAGKASRTSQRVGRFVGKHPDASAATAGAAVGSAAGAGVNEGTRQFRNKKSGVKVSVKDQYAHPYKSNAKWTNASQAKKGK